MHAGLGGFKNGAPLRHASLVLKRVGLEDEAAAAASALEKRTLKRHPRSKRTRCQLSRRTRTKRYH